MTALANKFGNRLTAKVHLVVFQTDAKELAQLECRINITTCAIKRLLFRFCILYPNHKSSRRRHSFCIAAAFADASAAVPSAAASKMEEEGRGECAGNSYER